MRLPQVLLWSLVPAVLADFWLEQVPHQGVSPYGPAGYTVYRNVKEYGAVGDGTTDDTAAIQRAIADGPRCEAECGSSTTTPALVYFPSGTYKISSVIRIPYFTQLIGDYNSMPVLQAAPEFPGGWMLDFNPYGDGGVNWVGPTNNFFKSLINFVIDLRQGPANATGIHWQVSQATTLTHVEFQLNSGTEQVGVFIENGSLGLLSDLVFNGGTGLRIGNQQFTLRGLTL